MIAAGEVDQASGCVLDLRLLSDVISRRIIRDVDHRDLKHRRAVARTGALWPVGQHRAAPSQGTGLAAAPRPPLAIPRRPARRQWQREASIHRAFLWSLPACSLQVTLPSRQWRGSGGPGLAAITLTRAWAWSWVLAAGGTSGADGGRSWPGRPVIWTSREAVWSSAFSQAARDAA